MTLTVRQCNQSDAAAWEAFVENDPHATFFHRFGWRRVIQESFGHTPYFLLAEEINDDQSAKIVGLLPLFQMRSFLFGSKLTSLPFCVYGGIIGSKEAEAALRTAACELAGQLNVDALELRNSRPTEAGWPIKDLYYTFRKSISTNHDENLKAIPVKQRAMVRKGIAAGLVSEEDTDSTRFYRVYAESVRNLGTPVFSARYLKILLDEFASDCRVLMIRDGDEDVAGVMSFYFRDQVLPYYGGSIARARSIKGCNDFMYWELMRRSVDEGLTTFDFGRSKLGTGPFKFKKHWGFKPEPLPYEYYLVASDEIPDVNPNNPRYKLLINTWRKLPMPVANLIGPPLARELG